MENFINIYELIDPRNNYPRYIGKTIKSVNRRLNGHIQSMNKGYHSSNWIKSLIENNLKPIPVLIDKVPQSEWQFWERHYISLYRSWGFNLTNITDGGEGNRHTKESKSKISKSNKNKSHGVLDKNVYRFIHKNGDVDILTRREFCKKYNVKQSVCSNLILGRHKSSFGWNIDYIKSRLNTKPLGIKMAVNKCDLNKVILEKYSSIGEAALKNKLSKSSIHRCIKNGKIYGNFKWQYANL